MPTTNATRTTSDILTQYIIDIETGSRSSFYRKSNIIGDIKRVLVEVDAKQRERIKQILSKDTKTISDTREILAIIREEKEQKEREKDVIQAQERLVNELYKSNFLAGLIGSIVTGYTQYVKDQRELREEEEELTKILNKRKKEESKSPVLVPKKRPISPTAAGDDERSQVGVAPSAVVTELKEVNTHLKDIIAIYKKSIEGEKKKEEDDRARKNEEKLEKQAMRVQGRIGKKTPSPYAQRLRNNPEAGGYGPLPFVLAGSYGLKAILPILSGMFRKIFLPAAIAFSAYEFFKGFGNASSVLGKKDVSLPEKLKAGIANSISGLFMNLFTPQDVVGFFDGLSEVFAPALKVIVVPFKAAISVLIESLEVLKELFTGMSTPLNALIDLLYAIPIGLAKNLPNVPVPEMDLSKIKTGELPIIFPEDEETIRDKAVKKLRQSKKDLKKKLPTGSVAMQEESSGNPGAIGAEAQGGFSYGVFQLYSRSKSLGAFLEESGYDKEFKGMEPESPEFNRKWKEIAKKEPEKFKQAQVDYAIKHQYNPVMEKLATRVNLPLQDRGQAVQESIFSTVNQFGGVTGPSIIARALEGKSLDELSDTDIINAIQDYKAENIDKLFKTAIASNPVVKQQQLSRIERERKTLIQLTESEEKTASQEEMEPTPVMEYDTTARLSPSAIPSGTNNQKGYTLMRESIDQSEARNKETANTMNNVITNVFGVGGGVQKAETGSGHRGVPTSRSTSSAYLRAINKDFVVV